jgi:hypothetical protein
LHVTVHLTTAVLFAITAVAAETAGMGTLDAAADRQLGLRFAQAHFGPGKLWEFFDSDRAALNIAHECIDRHATDAARVAVRVAQAQRDADLPRAGRGLLARRELAGGTHGRGRDRRAARSRRAGLAQLRGASAKPSWPGVSAHSRKGGEGCTRPLRS